MQLLKFFHLKEHPFESSPDPKILFPGENFKQTLKNIWKNICSANGFVLLTGQEGTGKTLLLKAIQNKISLNHYTCFIADSQLTPRDLLEKLLEHFGVYPDIKDNVPMGIMLRKLHVFLMDRAIRNERVIIFIDNLHDMPDDTLKELKSFTDLEADNEKVLQIVLAGRPQCQGLLGKTELKSLTDRIKGDYRLNALSRNEVVQYIAHRVKVSSINPRDRKVKFTPKALLAVYKISQGIPGTINAICRRTMAAALDNNSHTINLDIFKQAIEGQSKKKHAQGFNGLTRVYIKAVAVFLIILSTGIFIFLKSRPGPDPDLFTRNTPALPTQHLTEQGNQNAGDMPGQTQTHDQRHDNEVSAQKVSDQEDIKIRQIKIDQPPPEALHVSSGAEFIRVLIDQGMAQIWKGTDQGLLLFHTVDYDWHYGPGLFLTGNDPDTGPYVFNHQAHLLDEPSLTRSAFFTHLDEYVHRNAAPVLATSATQTLQLDSESVEVSLKHSFNRFIHTWKNMKIDDLFEIYADEVIQHYMHLSQPVIFDHHQAYLQKQELFSRTDFIALEVAKPVFLMHPHKPEQIMAVYHQKYRSDTLEDEGTKVLFFTKNPTASNYQWLVNEEFWVRDM